ncbi:uncharacterized protein LOC124271854 isoform X1 [Haliotis rubra]|uniref:uncharacterized protein LOC124271854 isoform X1 n=1 Tax=Haliotis rubra TaxID=36100 RepID=UPI001EE5438D|nr:uncharacterized protein LOC124271854 isoform X1 [Haliotis rubra]
MGVDVTLFEQHSLNLGCNSRAQYGGSGVFMSSRRPDDPTTPMRSDRLGRFIPDLHEHQTDLRGSGTSHESRAQYGGSGVFMSTRRPDDPTTPMRSDRLARFIPDLHEHQTAKALNALPGLGEANFYFDPFRLQSTLPGFTTDRPFPLVADYEERPSSSCSRIGGKSPVRRKSRQIVPGPDLEPEPDYDPSRSCSRIWGKSPVRRMSRRIVPGPDLEPEPDYDPYLTL